MAILEFFGMFTLFLVPAAIVAFIVCAVINNEKGNDVSKFSNGVRTVYTYVIIIATLIMIVVGTIVAVSSLLDYFLPESELEYRCTDNYSSRYCKSTTKEQRVQNERNMGITEFASSLALVIVSTPIFVSYSKDAKGLREAKDKNRNKM